MTRALNRAEPDNHRLGSRPAADLETQARSVLDNAVDAQRKGLKVYESLRNLNEVIGTEYGDRVLYELTEGRVFDWTLEDAQACARIMETKRHRGEPLDGHLPDAMIAAAALNRRLTVMTGNERKFRNTGVPLVNPRTESLSM